LNPHRLPHPRFRNHPEFAQIHVHSVSDAKTQLIEKKTLMLGKIEDKRRRGWQRMRWLDSITD